MELMFINKTAKSKSLSKSAGREKAKIFSHVQRGPAGGRVDEDAGHRPTSAKGRQEGPRREKSNVRSKRSKQAALTKDDLPQDNSRTQEQASVTRKDSGCSPESGSCYILRPLPGETGSWNVKDLPDVIRIHAARLDDPNNSDLVPDFADENVVTAESIATAYMNTYFYSTQYACERFSAHEEITESFKYAVGLAETDLALRISLVCCVAASLSLITKDEMHTTLAFHFKRLVLRHLRKQLNLKDSDAVPESTIMAISLLLWVECIEGNTDHAAAHVSALELMMSRFTSLEQVPLSLATAVFDFPFLTSAMMRTRPIPLPAATEATSISPAIFTKLETLAARDLPYLGSRFSAEPTASALGTPLLTLISRQRMCRIFRISCRNKTLSPSPAELQAFAAENMQISHALVTMAFDATPLTPLQNAVRLAVFASFQTIVPIMGQSTAFCRAMFQQLREAIEGIDPGTLWAPKLEVLLWVALVCAHLAYEREDWDWAARNMNCLITTSGFETREQVSGVLLGYFYTGVLCRPTLDRVWDEREKYRQESSPELFGWAQY